MRLASTRWHWPALDRRQSAVGWLGILTLDALGLGFFDGSNQDVADGGGVQSTEDRIVDFDGVGGAFGNFEATEGFVYGADDFLGIFFEESLEDFI